MFRLSAEEWTAVRLSLQVSVLAVAATLPLGLALGYVLARRVFVGKWLVELLVNLPLVLPPVVTGYLLLVMFGTKGIIGGFLQRKLGVEIAFTWLGAVLASAVMSFPLLVRAIRISMQGVDPRLEQAARSLGAGWWRTFVTILLPLSARGVLAGCVLAFARSLGEFGATIMLAANIEGQTQTIPLAIYSLVNQPGGMQESWRLVGMSILLSAAALAASEWLERRQTRHELP